MSLSEPQSRPEEHGVHRRPARDDEVSLPFEWDCRGFLRPPEIDVLWLCKVKLSERCFCTFFPLLCVLGYGACFRSVSKYVGILYGKHSDLWKAHWEIKPFFFDVTAILPCAFSSFKSYCLSNQWNLQLFLSPALTMRMQATRLLIWSRWTFFSTGDLWKSLPQLCTGTLPVRERTLCIMCLF